ncbi:STAS domain-containing protein [Catellatospora chokoriensis]|uniref:STAS domain-containing protein n=1 Tax=Catellatospora chokoriensis TaxID=310353 RepID=A0A8J3NWX3_9ACTN|nr:STAS domain-containing protein [Catellatospora chokoriensis]GIF93725.1 hypothetical protein Cch02nite_71690 [Catellatospora chokoriensis]
MVAFLARWQVPVVEVVVQGDLDASSAAEVGRVLGEALDLRPRELVVDLAGCRSVDVHGVRVLLEARRRVAGLGAAFQVRPAVAGAVQVPAVAAWQELIAPVCGSTVTRVEAGPAGWTADGPDWGVAASADLRDGMAGHRQDAGPAVMRLS